MPRSSLTARTFQSLMSRIKRKNEQAAEEMAALAMPLLMAYFLARRRNWHDAQRLSQDTLAKVVRSARTYKPRRDSGLGWLFRVASTVAIDFDRSEAVHASTRSLDAPNAPVPAARPDIPPVELRDLQDAVWTEVRNLPEPYQTLLVDFLLDITLTDTARRLHMSVGNASKLRQAGLRRLKHPLANRLGI